MWTVACFVLNEIMVEVFFGGVTFLANKYQLVQLLQHKLVVFLKLSFTTIFHATIAWLRK